MAVATKKKSQPKRAKRYASGSKPMTFRITPGTKKILTETARANGRTPSSECEIQLQRALSDWGNSHTNAIMTVVGQAIDRLTGIRDFTDENLKSPPPAVKWWNDPYLYAQVEHVTIAALQMFRPRMATPKISKKDIVKGDFVLGSLINEIQTADDSVPFEKQKPHQRSLNRLRKDLGLLADRPAPFGINGAEAREKQQAVAPFREELIALSRKDAASKQKQAFDGGTRPLGPPLTKAEEKKLAELRRKEREA